jgi:hypothetical protein
MNRKDLKNKVFGRLTVLEYSYTNNHKRACWKCQCQCGNTVITTGHDLINGHTRSCGCLNKDIVKENSTTHGDKKTRIYRIFYGLKGRCNNVKHYQYKYYGRRGIKCEWNNYEEFKKDMYDSYTNHCKEYGEKQTTIDRIDINGNYCKENCRWATYKEQNNNKRKNHFIEYNGETKTVSQWSEDLGINKSTMIGRIRRNNPIDKILEHEKCV